MSMLMKFKTTLAVMMFSILCTRATVLANGLTAGVSSEVLDYGTENTSCPNLTAGIGSILSDNVTTSIETRVIADKYALLNQRVAPDVSIEGTDVIIVTASLDDIAVEQENKKNKETESKDNLEVVDTEVKEIDKTLYVKSEANVRAMPTTESEVLDKLSKGNKITVTGETKKWYRVKYKEADAFISKDLCQESNPVSSNESNNKKDNKDTKSSTPSEWNGAKLTRQAGTVQGPSGKETYYNLNMSGVVSRLHRLGYQGDYWVRDDGVKMFGSYILVAASFDIRPIGTILPTSLGMGIVADTGGFARHNKYQLDIATNW